MCACKFILTAGYLFIFYIIFILVTLREYRDDGFMDSSSLYAVHSMLTVYTYNIFRFFMKNNVRLSISRKVNQIKNKSKHIKSKSIFEKNIYIFKCCPVHFVRLVSGGDWLVVKLVHRAFDPRTG